MVSPESTWDAFLPCVQRVGEAASYLQQVLFGAEFPDLSQPESDADAVVVVEKVREWADQVVTAYGDPSADPDGEGLLTALGAGGRSAPLPYPAVGSAFDIFGPVPHHLQRSFAQLHFPVLFGGPPNAIPDDDGEEWIAVSVENWPRIQALLEARRRLVFAQTTQLLAWVEDRLSSLKKALVPTLRAVARGERNSVIIEVMLGGFRRTVQVTHEMHEALKEMKATGQATVHRSQMQDLRRRVPELAGSIEADKGRSGTRDRAVYRLEASARERLQPLAD